MATPEQYLQTQLTEVTNAVSAHSILVEGVHAAATQNKRALKRAHERLDILHEQVTLMAANQMTRQDIEEVLATSFNKKLVTAIKGVFVTGIGGAVLAYVTGAIEHLSGK
jgi:hypothetical protein